MTAFAPYIPPATATDEYCLTMPRVYWLEGMNEPTSFELFVRSLPRNYGYLLAAGLEDALRYLQAFRFTDFELAELATHTVDPFDPGSPMLYESGFLDFLADLRYTGEVHALPEGTAFYAGEPVARFLAPRIENTIVEPALLSIFNRQTAVATKAARMVSVARGRGLWEAGLRRAPGPETGPANARAAYIAGMVGTSNVHARIVHGIPSTGTTAHAFIQAFGSEDREQDAMEAWLRHNPHRADLLVDTYNTPRGVQRAIAASRNTGVALRRVRIDSGDLVAEGIAARAALDAAGMGDVEVRDPHGNLLGGQRAGIMPTGDIDEYTIEDIFNAGGELDTSYSGPRSSTPARSAASTSSASRKSQSSATSG